MDELPAKVPHSLLPDLVSAFVPLDTPRGSILELVISVESVNLPAKEFAEYVALIDRIYGRMSREGLKSYAHRTWGRLEIAEIRIGSTELIYRFIYDHVTDAATVIIILLFLKGLPNMFKITAEGIKHLAEAYKSYEEGRAVREDRLHIAARQMGQELFTTKPDVGKPVELEPAVQQMDEKRKDQLAALLNALYKEEKLRLPAPKRFARRQVLGVMLRIFDKNPPK
jgi:hypothetical protein